MVKEEQEDRMKEHKLRKKKKFKILPYLMVLPTVIAYGLWCYYPFLKSVVLSMSVSTPKGDIKKWVWLNNFIRLFKAPKTWQMIGNTFKFALIIGIGTLSIALILSLLCVEKRPFGRVYQTMYALPMTMGIDVVDTYEYWGAMATYSVVGRADVMVACDVLEDVVAEFRRRENAAMEGTTAGIVVDALPAVPPLDGAT